MQFTLSNPRLHNVTRLVLAAATAFSMYCAPFAGAASAEGAFIQQAPSTSRGYVNFTFLQNFARPVATPSRTRSFAPLPELTAPAYSGANSATTLQIGNYNHVLQLQTGSNNISNVGILGSYNNVGLLQAGHSLRSNLLLLNTSGLSVGVIQPNGSAPVNMLIARLPNGGLLIKR